MHTRTDTERLYYADWLRIAAFAWLVVYHVGMLYVPWSFHVKAATTFAALEPWMRLSSPWRMGLLFVISGLATGRMLGAVGAGHEGSLRSLARERSRRLLLPLLFGMVLIVPPQSYFEVQQQHGYAGSYLDFLQLYFTGFHGFCRPQGCLMLPTWNHLWFLPYLALYTLVLLAALRWGPRATLSRWADTLAARSSGFWLWAPIIALALARGLLYPRFGLTHALMGDWYAHATYLPLFLTGVLLARRERLRAIFEQLRWPALAAALLAWWGLNTALAAPPGAVGADAWRLASRGLFGAQQWAAIVAALGFASRHLNHDHRWRAALTQAVFPLYLVHQTLILCGFVALAPAHWPPALEAAALVLCTFAGGALAWQLALRLPGLQIWMGLAPRRQATAAPGWQASGAGARQ